MKHTQDLTAGVRSGEWGWGVTTVYLLIHSFIYLFYVLAKKKMPSSYDPASWMQLWPQNFFCDPKRKLLMKNGGEYFQFVLHRRCCSQHKWNCKLHVCCRRQELFSRRHMSLETRGGGQCAEGRCGQTGQRFCCVLPSTKQSPDDVILPQLLVWLLNPASCLGLSFGLWTKSRGWTLIL